MQNLVSIIIPVYNTNIEFFKFCIMSILNQSYASIEIILVDDGSSNGVEITCDEFSNLYHNIKVIHQHNQGVSVARNNGISISKGNLITFIDADDWVDEEYIEYLVNKIKENDSDISMCCRFIEHLDKQEKNHFFNEDILFNENNRNTLIYETIKSGIGGTWCKLYKKKFLLQNNLYYNPKLRRTQDIVFNLYAFHFSTSTFFGNKCLYHYRKSNESITSRYNPNADEYLYLAIKEIKKFTIKYYDADKKIKSGLYYKTISVLTEILDLKYFNKEYLDNNRYENIDKLCNISVFKEAIFSYESDSLIVSLKVFLLKHRLYRLLNLFFLVRNAFKRKKY